MCDCFCLFFSPIIEAVTFRLHGWCMFLLPAFTYLGYESQDLLSPCDGMHICVQTRPRFFVVVFFPSERVLGESEPMLTPMEKSPQPEIFFPEEDRTHDAASSRAPSPTHYQ